MNPYIENILEQPDALRTCVSNFDGAALAGARLGSFERIVITGMGGSHFAGYPAWLTLIRAGLPVWHVESSELLHQMPELVTRKTLLIMLSQSGRSAEVLALLDKVVPAQVLAVTNDVKSPLAECANAVLDLHAGTEDTVSTKTYMNTIAVTALMARQLAGQSLDTARTELLHAADTLSHALADWQLLAAHIAERVGAPERLLILGRGASLASACVGALVLKEAAKLNAEGMSAGQFRHGPLELADPRLSVLVLAGEGPGRALNERLVTDLQGYGARAHLLAAHSGDIVHPAAAGAGLPIAEMLPLQMLSVHVAESTGFVPGQFRHSRKVTVAE